VLLDFFADWCRPCRQLAPVVEEVAAKYPDRVSVYKVDVDEHRDLAMEAGVTGIPFVLLVQKGRTVHAMTGLQPRDAYFRAVERFLATADGVETADGRIVEGVRVVRRSTRAPLDTIYVYRGETVKLVIEDVDFAYGIHVPDFDISQQGTVGRPLEVTFKARDVGVFPVFCNGDCPSGDGQQFGQIVVLQYGGTEGVAYRELSAPEARRFIAEADPLVLDVRTPAEYYQGHLPGAVLIPVQQLQQRLREMQPHKEREIVLYCRSGNRSTVAAEILADAGFRRLHNIRHGILEWQREGFDLTK
jgi:thioredoxin